MTQEMSLEQLQAQHAEDMDAVQTAQKALKAAEKALEAGRQEPLERLVELATAKTQAEKAVKGAENVAANTQRRIDNFQFEAKKGERDALEATTTQDIGDVVDFDQFASVGADKVVATIDIQARTVTLKATGPGYTGTRAPRASGGNGRGRKTYSINGENLDSRGLVERFGPEHLTGKVTAEMVLADPTKHGLSHVADRIADKVGATIAQAAPTTE